MKKRPLFLVWAGLMIAIWMCKAAGLPVFGAPCIGSETESALEEGRVLRAEGIIQDRQKKTSSTQYILKDTSAAFRGETIRLKKIKLTIADDAQIRAEGRSTQESPAAEEIPVQAAVRITGKLSRIPRAGNPGQFDSRAYYACRGIYYEMYGTQVQLLSSGGGLREKLIRARERVAAGIAADMSPDSAGLLCAMILGDRSGLTEEDRLNFRYGGIMHVLAVSGFHISLFGMLLYRILLYLFFFISGKRTGPLLQAAAGTGAAVFMAGYCLMVGLPSSAVRAFIMFCCLMLGKMTRKSYDSVCSLALAGILILSVQPGCLFDAGFQLSFAAVLGIGMVYPLLLSVIPGSFWKKGSRRKQLLEKGIRAVFSWLAVSLMTVPLTARYFYEIPVLGLPVSLAVIPFLGPLMGLGAAGGALSVYFPAAAGWILRPVDLFLRGLLAFTGLVRRCPFAVWICGQPGNGLLFIYYLALFFWVFVENRKRKPGGGRAGIRLIRLAPALCFCLLFFRKSVPYSITMLDVGQGDGLVLTSCGRVFVSDCGSSSVDRVGTYRLMPYLKQQGISYVDGIFLSHADADHVNGAEELLEAVRKKETAIRVGKVYLPEWMTADETGQQILELCGQNDIPVYALSAGDRIESGGMTFEVLHPKSGETAGGNAGSLVLRAEIQGFRLLLTGDLEAEGEEEILSSLTETDCLKVAHHGSRNSSTAAFLDKISPKVCLISAPRNSPYGHPHQETLDRISRTGADCYVTGRCGAIRIVPEKGGFSVQTYFGSGFR